jgi:hypothetical protein
VYFFADRMVKLYLNGPKVFFKSFSSIAYLVSRCRDRRAVCMRGLLALARLGIRRGALLRCPPARP